MSFQLPTLPYAEDALEPHIDARTMNVHHTKHHAAYTTNLNAAIEGTEYADWPIETLLQKLDELPASIRTKVRNNGGGFWNHNLFWEIMSPDGGGEPTGDLAAAIEATFGSFDAFKTLLVAAGMGQFGSGWAWLSVNSAGGLEVSATPNQDSPVMEGKTPILGVDVWEHAYYLHYQNRRADYLNHFFNVINWNAVAERYAAAL
jgi:Fe-Mn family superoxide dismutase